MKKIVRISDDLKTLPTIKPTTLNIKPVKKLKFLQNYIDEDAGVLAFKKSQIVNAIGHTVTKAGHVWWFVPSKKANAYYKISHKAEGQIFEIKEEADE